METSLNDMSGTNGLNEENLSSLKGMLHQLFHLEDKDLRTYSPLLCEQTGLRRDYFRERGGKQNQQASPNPKIQISSMTGCWNTPHAAGSPVST